MNKLDEIEAKHGIKIDEIIIMPDYFIKSCEAFLYQTIQYFPGKPIDYHLYVRREDYRKFQLMKHEQISRQLFKRGKGIHEPD